MRRSTLEPEVISPALQYGMLADRAGVALWRVSEGTQLSQPDRRALRNMRSFLQTAVKGGAVLRTRSMASYSSVAMSAYETAIKAAPRKELDDQEGTEAIKFLEGAVSAIEAVERRRPMPEGWSFELLTKFLDAIVTGCLEASARPVESVSL